MNRIKRVSYYWRIIFQILFFLVPLSLIAYWIYVPSPAGMQNVGFSFSFVPGHIPGIGSELSIETKILIFLLSLIPNGFAMLILYFLIKLFRLYEQGIIFTLNNVNYFKKIGYVLLISQVINPFYEALMSLVVTWHNGVGRRIIAFGFGDTNFAIVIIALLIILVAWVMAEGCRLHEEQELTI